MSSLLQTDPEQVKRFILQHARPPQFTAVIAVSVDRYPSELFATIWVGQEPDAEMRAAAHDMEVQLRNQGVVCTIVVKTDRDLSLGGTHDLSTSEGHFKYKFYRIDSELDEDLVYVYALYRGAETFRFRLSLNGRLAEILRSRNRLNESDVEATYLEWIRREIKAGRLGDEHPRPVTFTTRDLPMFIGRD